ncbi:MAG: methionyl-tRNA formyltransferase [Acidobacteriota bacterium]|nr:methionyl-tRNA formyltransferase [Acidobacteriota bacterium]
MQVVFFGSPSFALPSLESLRDAGHTLALVVSQPGKPVGRKGEVTDPPVAVRAKSLGIQVFQPPTLKDDAAVARLSAACADVFVVVAYGKILAQRVLDLPRLGCVNVHGSLLPRWRGASPVQAAILAGDAATGISIMKMDAGMDTGPVYTMRETRIAEEESAEGLGARLAQMGAASLVETLYFLEGEEGRNPLPQNSSLATSCPKITREDARVDWTRPAIELARRSRAFTPWPGLFTIRRNTRVKLFHVSLEEEGGWTRSGAEKSSPGTILEAGTRLVVACGEGALSIGTLQVEGRRALPAAEFVRGERVLSGERWG